MPTVAGVSARLEREGEFITVSMADGTTTVAVKAFVRGYQASELVNDIIQGDREVRIAPSALAAAGFPRFPDRLDKVEIDGQEATVQVCETRKLRGVPVMHVMLVRG